MPLKSIQQVENLKEKRVLVRVDFNVPIKDGKIEDDTRLLASLPTIEYLKEKGAKVILMTHLGRPGGKVVEELRVEPIAKSLEELLHCQIVTLSHNNLENSKEMIDKMGDGDVVMLENVRFSPDEKKNTGNFAKNLASLADIFVLDGFAVAHRASASVVGVAEFLPSYAGLLLEKEINGLNKVLESPEKPFVVVLGGAKIETKIPVMKNLLDKADAILIGGGIVNTYLKAVGFEVGSSLIDDNFIDEALKYCSNENVVKPVDVIVGKKDGSDHRVVKIDIDARTICENGEAIFDIGPKTIELFKKEIDKAKTVVWNGAMGYFEQKPYDVATLKIAEFIADASKAGAYSVIGGGETLQSMDLIGRKEDIDLVSTGGGAMLSYLAGEKLSGIEAIQGS